MNIKSTQPAILSTLPCPHIMYSFTHDLFSAKASINCIVLIGSNQATPNSIFLKLQGVLVGITLYGE